MATILYREGNAERIEPEHVESCLINGYFLTRDESIGEISGDTDENSVDGSDDNSDQDDDNSGSEIADTSDEDEFRLIAESLGIEGWNTLDIETLKLQIEENSDNLELNDGTHSEDEFTP